MKTVWFYFRPFVSLFVCLTCDFHMRVLPMWDSNTPVSSRFQNATPTSASGSERKKTPSWHLLIISSWLFPFGTSPVGCCPLVPKLSFGVQNRQSVMILSTNQSALWFFSLQKLLPWHSSNTLGHWHHWAFAKLFSLFSLFHSFSLTIT